MGQGFTLIYRFKLAWMDEFVLKPREFCGIESLHQPVDHAPYPGDTAATRMIGKPNVEWPAQFDLERNDFSPELAGVGRKHADTGPIGDRPVIGAADVGFHHQQVPLGTTWKKALKSLFGGGLVGDLHHQPVLGEVVDGSRDAVSIDVFLAGKEHQMHSAEPD